MAVTFFTLRPRVPGDALSIIETQRAAIRGTSAGFYSHEVIEEWAPIEISPERRDGFARAMAGGEEIVVVAVDPADRMLGFGSIVPGKDEVRAVYVRPEAGRHGIGRAILQRLEVLAREAGLKELKMDASVNAESFYRASGFSSEGAAEHPMPSGRRMACIRMRKSL